MIVEKELQKIKMPFKNDLKKLGVEATANLDDDRTDVRVKESRENDIIDSKYGFDRLSVGEKTAYLINMHATEVIDDDKRLIAAVDYYFIQEDGARLDFESAFIVQFRRSFNKYLISILQV